MKIGVQAKSTSGGGPYDVTFVFDGRSLKVTCTCLAGQHATACKHRIRLIEGDETMLEDPGQVEKLHEVSQWARETEFDKVIGDLIELEELVEKGKRAVKEQKRKIAHYMENGYMKGDE